jgi:hypothetical protein
LIEEIKKNQNAAVSLFNPPTIIRPFAALTKDPKLEFNVSFQVTSNTAKNLRPYAEMWLEDSPPNGHADRDVVTRFKIETAKNMPDRGTDLGPSTIYHELEHAASGSVRPIRSGCCCRKKNHLFSCTSGTTHPAQIHTLIPAYIFNNQIGRF